jgi:hypothetical protein
MVKKSLWRHSRVEIERHKWIESEKAGRDLGESAIFGWIAMHWNGYLRARWVEHLQGKTFWVELDRGTFGVLAQRFQDKLPLLDLVVDRFKAGQENLHIIWWAIDTKHAMDDVHAMLEALDVNGARLGYRFDD